jgi:DMSO/TMAO reductase YedYZ molybdopterin-dependent catalytic subunit
LAASIGKLVTLIGFAVSVVVFERALVLGFRFLSDARTTGDEFSPRIGRRAFVLGTLGVVIAGGGVALARKLYRAATFSYDGTQYKGRIVQPITPNDLFYCVTKNVVDPRVDVGLWHLDVSGLVENPRTYRLEDLKAITPVEQETTLMCISNGLDAGLMSNAVWKGVAMHDLLDVAAPLANATKVRLHGVDNYTDTFALEKAMDPTTIIAYEMNGVKLPHRHGYPARVVVPGYFGEKHVKWLTRIEVTTADAKGFYETQGWGPDFIVPTRSRIDVPYHEEQIAMRDVQNGIAVRGVAFGGDRGVSKVEVSVDDGENWQEAKIDYPGTKLTWALWSFDWRPQTADDYSLVVRATDGEGELQEFDEDRPFKSGVTGFHKIRVHITA